MTDHRWRRYHSGRGGWIHSGMAEFEDSVRRLREVFSGSRSQAEAMLDALAQTPLADELAVWESEGGAT